MSHKPHIDSAHQLVIRTIWPFVLIVLILLGSTLVSLDILSAVRAYVGGESLWSKGQKQAHISLTNYINFQEDVDFQAFLKAISMPKADNLARQEMDKAEPDLDIIFKGFVTGGNHPDDIPGMIRLYRHFAHTPFFEEPIRFWVAGEAYITELDVLGQQDFLLILNRRIIHQHVNMVEPVWGWPSLKNWLG